MNKALYIPEDIEQGAKDYMKNVIDMLESNGVMETVDTAALTMLARNYSIFIKASKQLEEEGLTVTSDRGNITAHPAIKIANDAQTKAMKIMTEFGLTAKARTKLPRMETAESSPLEAFARTAKVESR